MKDKNLFTYQNMSPRPDRFMSACPFCCWQCLNWLCSWFVPSLCACLFIHKWAEKVKKKKKCKSVSPSNFALHRPCFTFLSFFLSFFFFFFFVFLIVSDNVSFVGSLSVENVIRSPAKFFSELSSSGPPILPKKKYLAPWSLNAVYCIVWALWRLAGAHVPANSSQICHTDKICPPPPHAILLAERQWPVHPCACCWSWGSPSAPPPVSTVCVPPCPLLKVQRGSQGNVVEVTDFASFKNYYFYS